MKLPPGGILPPLVTPFKKDRLDREAFLANLKRLNATELAGYVVLGSNGEGVYMSDDEAIQVIETAAEGRDARKALIVGTGRESTTRTVEFTRRAAEAGAEAAMVVPPAYYRGAMSESALDFHYRSVADASTIPILLYHVPKFSPVVFSPRLVENLSSHPNVVGIKDTSGDMVFLASILRDRAEEFQVYVGSASFLLSGLALGAEGGILALANIAPEQCVALFRMLEAGDLEPARKLQYRLLPVNQAITARFGVAGLKMAHDLLGYRGGEPRRPLEPLSQKQMTELTRILRKAGLLLEPAGKGK